MREKESFPDPLPVIFLGEDREVLARKLEEYKRRLGLLKDPDDIRDVQYKIAITQALVQTGQADPAVIAENLKTQDGTLDELLFLNAWDVIEDYVKTGGKKTFGGTGLYGERKMPGSDE